MKWTERIVFVLMSLAAAFCYYQVSTKQDAMSDSFNNFQKAFVYQTTQTNAQLQQLSENMVILQNWTKKLDRKVEKLDRKVEKLHKKVEKLDERVGRLEGIVKSQYGMNMDCNVIYHDLSDSMIAIVPLLCVTKRPSWQEELWTVVLNSTRFPNPNSIDQIKFNFETNMAAFYLVDDLEFVCNDCKYVDHCVGSQYDIHFANQLYQFETNLEQTCQNVKQVTYHDSMFYQFDLDYHLSLKLNATFN